MNRTKWMMAAMLSVSTMATINAQTSSPVKDDLFAGTEIFAKNATDVNEISMDPAMLGMVSGREGHKAHGMVLNVVHSYSYDKPGMYNIADVEAFRNKLNTGDWHCSVHTRDLKHGESTDICNKQRTDGLKETAIITVEPKELTFIHTITHEGGGDSYLMLPGLAGFPQMAMLNVQPQLNLALNSLNTIDFGRMEAEIEAHTESLKALSNGELQRRMADAQRLIMESQQAAQEYENAAPPPPHAKKPE